MGGADMDIRDFVSAMANIARSERSNYHTTLGEAIEALKPANPRTPVVLDVGGSVGKIGSYRGYYADLALAPSDVPMDAASLIDRLVIAVGETFIGYKGGEFTMGLDTPLWVAPYGDATGIAVVGVSVGGDVVTIHTRQID